MNVKAFFTVHSIIAFVFALGFIAIPARLVAMYGGNLNAAGVFMARLFASALFTYAAVLWFARNCEDSSARRAIISGFCLTMFIGAGVALHGQLTHVVNALGWSTVALYTLLGICYLTLMRR